MYVASRYHRDIIVCILLAACLQHSQEIAGSNRHHSQQDIRIGELGDARFEAPG